MDAHVPMTTNRMDPAAAGACARSGFPKAARGGLLSTPCAADRSCPKRPLTWAFLPAYLPGGARLCDCLPGGASRYRAWRTRIGLPSQNASARMRLNASSNGSFGCGADRASWYEGAAEITKKSTIIPAHINHRTTVGAHPVFLPGALRRCGQQSLWLEDLRFLEAHEAAVRALTHL